MSYCESCGRELRAGAAFCGSCGAQALPPLGIPAQEQVAPSGPGAQAPVMAAGYARPQSLPLETSGSGVALVVIGAVLALLFTFVSYGRYWSSYSGGVDQAWVFSTGAWAWTRLWPPNELFWGAGSWPALMWFQQITSIAAMITTVLCVVAAILAVIRASGARVGGGIIRAFGIAAVVTTIAYIISGLFGSEYRWIALTDLAALAGAVLVIIGGGLLGPASAPTSTNSAQLPSRTQGTY